MDRKRNGNEAMKRTKKKRIRSLRTAADRAWLTLPLAALALAAPPAAGAAAGQTGGGFYVGGDVGVSVARDLESARTNVGVPTNCDQWLAAAVLNDGTRLPLPADQCRPRALPARASAFDLGAGWLAGAGAGYDFGPVRVEAEYFHRRQGGETVDLVVPGDDKQPEFTERTETIDQVRGHNFFGNVYYDVPTSSRVTPWVGAGFGVMRTTIDYRATSIRTADRAALLALGRNPNAAGVVSRADDAMTDSLAGYQVIAGFDYAVGARQALAVKFRYGDAFGGFSDGDKAWKPLRNHDSTVGPGGAPIRYGIDADNLGFWSVSVGYKFFLD